MSELAGMVSLMSNIDWILLSIIKLLQRLESISEDSSQKKSKSALPVDHWWQSTLFNANSASGLKFLESTWTISSSKDWSKNQIDFISTMYYNSRFWAEKVLGKDNRRAFGFEEVQKICNELGQACAGFVKENDYGNGQNYFPREKAVITRYFDSRIFTNLYFLVKTGENRQARRLSWKFALERCLKTFRL